MRQHLHWNLAGGGEACYPFPEVVRPAGKQALVSFCHFVIEVIELVLSHKDLLIKFN